MSLSASRAVWLRKKDGDFGCGVVLRTFTIFELEIVVHAALELES